MSSIESSYSFTTQLEILNDLYLYGRISREKYDNDYLDTKNKIKELKIDDELDSNRNLSKYKEIDPKPDATGNISEYNKTVSINDILNIIDDVNDNGDVVEYRNKVGYWVTKTVGTTVVANNNATINLKDSLYSLLLDKTMASIYQEDDKYYRFNHDFSIVTKQFIPTFCQFFLLLTLLIACVINLSIPSFCLSVI